MGRLGARLGENDGTMPPEEESHERELWGPGFFIVDEVVDIQSLARYSDLRVDRRQQDLTEYIALRKTRGWLDEKGLSHIEQRYRKKLIADRPLGRMYGDRLSPQSITKEARAAACRSFAVDVDFENAHASILSNSIQELDMKNVRNSIARHRLWREAVSSYHMCDALVAKKVLLRALYGFCSPREGVGRPGNSMPFLTGLAMDSISAQEKLSSMNPSVAEHFQASGRPMPEATAFAYLIAELEDSCLTSEIPQAPAQLGGHPT